MIILVIFFDNFSSEYNQSNISFLFNRIYIPNEIVISILCINSILIDSTELLTVCLLNFEIIHFLYLLNISLKDPRFRIGPNTHSYNHRYCFSKAHLLEINVS